MLLKNRLSELEQQIMAVIWSHPSSSAADIQKALEPQRPLKDSTIRTVLTRLEEKGYLEHVVEGRTFLYSGTERPGSVAAHAVKQILDHFCHGSLESLLVGLVDSEIVDADELQRIVARLGRSPSKQIDGKRKDRS